ncbi:hypothetical protein H2199_002080 [Coniosporium tulheliwenetii]|uniref:Uncharacterized protein n=1 Tax=Coniosporium tulheliwenetii TaxID=3383036 RepID=A0ACC2ZHT3_9PEZI|nr:hypothetical protein H2199_002080 [Cladosporium sp. JES 115]
MGGETHSGNGNSSMLWYDGTPIADRPQSYFSLSEHAGLMYLHILFMVIAWVVVLPVGLMFSIARSRYTLPTQALFLALNGLGLLLGVIYDRSTPDLYENNSHGKIGWALTWIASAWVLMGVVDLYASRAKTQVPGKLSAAVMAQYHRLQQIQTENANPSRWSNDSGQGTERNSASLYGSPRSASVGSEDHQLSEPQQSPYHGDDDDEEGADGEKRGFLRNNTVDRVLSRNLSRLAFGPTLTAVRFLYVAIERTIVFLGFAGITTGAVVYGGIARGDAVFNILAHFVKGGIFFWYGLITLGRWMGCFADLGWAWNIKPSKEIVGRRKAAIPSAEFTESFVIWLYGASNVFLEHLAAWGGKWTPQDLEHVSISIMFFGGGALGMLIESRKIRDLLNTTILNSENQTAHNNDEAWQPPKTYRVPLNPMPGLIILLLGIMMGSHHQASMLSTMIHKQWGTLFVGFSMARALTYILLYLSPPTSFLPARPPTEIITSFCLIAGGLIFMESNKDTVALLQSYNLDAMFTFTVTMGFTALLMAWTTFVLATKGWALRREASISTTNPSSQHSAGALA